MREENRKHLQAQGCRHAGHIGLQAWLRAKSTTIIALATRQSRVTKGEASIMCGIHPCAPYFVAQLSLPHKPHCFKLFHDSRQRLLAICTWTRRAAVWARWAACGAAGKAVPGL